MLEVNLRNKAITEHTRDFNSMCRVGDNYYGANSTGIYRICGVSDGGVEIPALIKTSKFDLGTERLKSIRYFYFGLETTGDLSLTLYVDDEEAAVYDIPNPGEGRQTIKVKVARGIKGRYWQFKLENVDGCFFALYSVKIFPVMLKSA